MKDKDINSLLEAFEVPAASIDAKIKCINNVKAMLPQPSSTRLLSMWGLVRAQASYMGKIEMACFHFVFTIVSMIALHIGASPFTDEALVSLCSLKVSISLAPFLVLPLIITLVRSHKVGMVELEDSCKYNLQKIVVARLLISGVVALCAIIILWIIAGQQIGNHSIGRLFYSVASYNISLILCLWFGKRTMVKGIIASVAWTGFVCVIVQSEGVVLAIGNISRYVSFEVFLVSIVASILAAAQYIKFTSYESENIRWNFVLTD